MNSEQLLSVIKSSKVEITNEEQFDTLDNDLNLVRNLYFTVDSKQYKINWFKNLMTLCVGENLEVKFTKVIHTGTWPNNYKRNLQFYQDGNCVCILGLEKYSQ